MPNGWGGSRPPGAPAPVSGPGALSARTDGGALASEPAYGEGQTLDNFKAAAPMATGGGAVSGAPSGGGDMLGSLTGLDAPSAQPGVPVTAGAALGDGPGVSALGLPQSPQDERRADVKSLGPAQIQTLIAAAGRGDATPSFRRMVRQVLYS